LVGSKAMRVWQLAAAVAAAIALAGCGDSRKEAKADPKAPPVISVSAASLDTIAKDGKGFSVGPSMSARTVYVFFDPQCPHCAALWQASKPLKSQARWVWIPVALLNDNSAPQGATLLAAPDPAAAMDQHETELLAKRGGIKIVPGGDVEGVKQNTKLLNSLGFSAVPALVGKHAQTGEIVTLEGAAPAAVLAQKLGLTPPP
jgi:thiol:disulfide interchange protein DsbG